IREWLARAENVLHGFATCAITQLGFIRIVSGKGYIRPVAPHEAAAYLEHITRKGHRYLGIPAPCEGATRWNAAGSGQSTDTVLLATAVAHGCRLVTFDTGIALGSVTGARRENLVVLGH